MPYYTPLRYPGGKRRLAGAVAQLMEANGIMDAEYVEPYAGGAAVGLSLLFEERASRIHINDLDRAVHAFWHSVLNSNEDLCAMIRRTRVSMAEWRRQRAVYLAAGPRTLELGFATFFLNRTNRSGIISGGVIGGKQQASKWRIGARYNKEDLIARIRKIGRYRSRIALSNMDALEFAKTTLPKLGRRAFTFFDPPYIENGEDLYLNQYKLEDHRRLAHEIAKLPGYWMVTYDDAAARERLYAGHRRIVYDLPYSAQARYQGKEVLFLSPDLRIPNSWRSDANRVSLTLAGSRHPLIGHLQIVRSRLTQARVKLATTSGLQS